MVLAQGDYVTLVFKSERREPADDSKTYTYYPVGVFRVENGKLAEHWGGEPKAAH
jgi:predicted SnoaL-like aldol condensation-catalyzing enzyme